MRLLAVSIFVVIALGSALAQGPGGAPVTLERPVPVRAEPPPKKAAPPPPKKEIPNPCKNKKCGVGEDCRPNPKNPAVAECDCIKSCNDREFPDPLCSNRNVTFNSICEFNRKKCMCNKRRGSCKPPGPGEYIVYYSECQNAACNSAFDMIDYANRLAQWLRDTHAARAMIPSDFEMDPESIMNPLEANSRRVSSAMYNSPDGNAVYVSWWFCDLDKNKDGSLDKKEISVITRALMPNEQCIQTFLSQCDKGSDNKITNAEWHSDSCFKVKKGKKSCADIFKLSSYI